jgi:uncharacterized protein (DUF1778 family)
MHESRWPTQAARIETRATVEQKTVIERAAALEGRTVSEFVLSTAVEHAEDVVERQRILRLSARHSMTSCASSTSRRE